MKYTLLIILFLMSCTKDETQPNNFRRADPMSGSNQQVVVHPSVDFNITWDSTTYCGGTEIIWDDKGADMYYVLFEGSGNSSCSQTYLVDGVTYYYPWSDTDRNNIGLLSGQVCGCSPFSTYNIIVRYYEFSKGKWHEYNSLPVQMAFGIPGYQCN